MLKASAALAALLVLGSAPLHAQQTGPRVGLHLGSAYGVSANVDDRPIGFLGRASGATRSTYRRGAAVPSGAISIDVPVGRRTEAGIEVGYLPIRFDTPQETVISQQFLTVAPTVGLHLGERQVRPRFYGGPALLFNVSQNDGAFDPLVETYTYSGIGFGASAGAGLVVPVGRGAFSDVRLDLGGTYARVSSSASYTSLGLRVGIGLGAPKCATEGCAPRPRPVRR